MVALSAMSIRNIDDRVKERLRIRAARHGRSMEAEVRAILTDAVTEPGSAEASGLAEAILDRPDEAGASSSTFLPGRLRRGQQSFINDHR